MIIHRLISLLEPLHKVPAHPQQQVDIYFCASRKTPQKAAVQWAERIRDAVPGVRLQVNAGGGSFKSQFKKADRSTVAWALVLGEQELSTNSIGLKPLRTDEEQQTLALDQLTDRLVELLSKQ